MCITKVAIILYLPQNIVIRDLKVLNLQQKSEQLVASHEAIFLIKHFGFKFLYTFISQNGMYSTSIIPSFYPLKD